MDQQQIHPHRRISTQSGSPNRRNSPITLLLTYIKMPDMFAAFMQSIQEWKCSESQKRTERNTGDCMGLNSISDRHQHNFINNPSDFGCNLSSNTEQRDDMGTVGLGKGEQESYFQVFTYSFTGLISILSKVTKGSDGTVT